MIRARALAVLLATVAGVAATVSLGRWQLGRAHDKQALHDTMASRQHLPPLDNAALPCDEAAWQAQLQRPVRLRGRWLVAHTRWLDNRPMSGRAGFIVLTPLLLEGGAPGCARAVLVQRGWVSRDPRDRLRVPPLPDVPGTVVLSGRLVAAPSRLMELGQAAAAAGPVRQNVDIPGLARETGWALRPGSIQQLADEAPAPSGGTGLARDWWQPQADVGKHQAYAAQWFAMAAVMVVLYGWFQWLKPRRATRP